MRSRRVGARVAFGSLLLPLLFAAGTQAAAQAPVHQAGERVASAKGCDTCHALPGEVRGKKPGPAFLSPAPPQAPSDVLRRLWNHIPGMRQHFLARGLRWPEIRMEEMTDLLGFLGAVSDASR